MRGAAVRQIIAIDGGQHHVAQLHQLDGARGVLGLLRIEPAVRVAGVDRAEAAGARAHRAHEHDGGSARVPALPDVGTLGLLAHGGEAMLPDERAHGVVARTGGRPGLQPRGLAASGRRR